MYTHGSTRADAEEHAEALRKERGYRPTERTHRSAPAPRAAAAQPTPIVPSAPAAPASDPVAKGEVPDAGDWFSKLWHAPTGLE